MLLGSSTITVWNRLESALSFSIVRRYSSSVVAPIKFNAPRASAGFRIFAASIAPSLLPAPHSKCISSINSKICSSSVASSIIPLILSSNSPRNFVPATSPERSTCQICFPISPPGTSDFTIRVASPSTIAVFPTPASPISTGFDFVRLDSTVTTRSISLSRPITASSFPARASSVKSLPYLFKNFRFAPFTYFAFSAFSLSSFVCSSTIRSILSISSSASTPRPIKINAAREFGCESSAYKICSVPITESPSSST